MEESKDKAFDDKKQSNENEEDDVQIGDEVIEPYIVEKQAHTHNYYTPSIITNGDNKKITITVRKGDNDSQLIQTTVDNEEYVTISRALYEQMKKDYIRCEKKRVKDKLDKREQKGKKEKSKQ